MRAHFGEGVAIEDHFQGAFAAVEAHFIHEGFDEAHAAPALFFAVGHGGFFWIKSVSFIGDADGAGVVLFHDVDFDGRTGVALVAVFHGVDEGFFQAQANVEGVIGLTPVVLGKHSQGFGQGLTDGLGGTG